MINHNLKEENLELETDLRDKSEFFEASRNEMQSTIDGLVRKTKDLQDKKKMLEDHIQLMQEIKSHSLDTSNDLYLNLIHSEHQNNDLHSFKESETD